MSAELVKGESKSSLESVKGDCESTYESEWRCESVKSENESVRL